MKTQRSRPFVAFFLGLVGSVSAWSQGGQPVRVVDLATVTPESALLTRVYGADGVGSFGVPVAAGHDSDGDGFQDYAIAYFTANPLDRTRVGEVDLIFGDGTLGATVDTAIDSPRFLRIAGAVDSENAGSEIWMDDVTGDGIGDLLIGRQNFAPDEARAGSGALTIVVGSPALREHAARLEYLDLREPPADIELLTLIGAARLDRFGIWMRTGDVDGDGIADIVVGADQEDPHGEFNSGAVYVLRGGPHLAEIAAAGAPIDLADFGTTPLAGHLARLIPPTGSGRYHLGATCGMADFDANGRAEILAAAALARAGASLTAGNAPPGSAEGLGGSENGSLFIAWDDNFPTGEWPAGFTINLENPPGTRTIIHGASTDSKFGEDFLGGLDFDADGKADLFVGDLLSSSGENDQRQQPGVGYVLFGIEALRGLEFDLDEPPPGLAVTRIYGPATNSISSDTSLGGDFNGDGIADLGVASPYDTPQDRFRAGTLHVLFGRAGGWPELVDLAPGSLPDADEIRIAEIQGARGRDLEFGFDEGDSLAYSAAAADLDSDGRVDLIFNEMLGNGLADDTVDVGNLVLLAGDALAPPCESGPGVLCLQDGRFRLQVEWTDFAGNRGEGRVVEEAEANDSGLFWFFSADNWEMLVKVLDGCAINDHFWVFAAATTNVEYTLRVTDSLSGAVREYLNPLGRAADAVTDTAAFPTCP